MFARRTGPLKRKAHPKLAELSETVLLENHKAGRQGFQITRIPCAVCSFSSRERVGTNYTFSPEMNMKESQPPGGALQCAHDPSSVLFWAISNDSQFSPSAYFHWGQLELPTLWIWDTSLKPHSNTLIHLALELLCLSGLNQHGQKFAADLWFWWPGMELTHEPLPRVLGSMPSTAKWINSIKLSAPKCIDSLSHVDDLWMAWPCPISQLVLLVQISEMSLET